MAINHSKTQRDRIRRVTAIGSNPGLSISRQAARKLFILYTFSKSRWAARGYLGHALSGIQELTQSKLGGEALIIANGHSVNQLNVEGVSEAVKNGLDVFALNSFLLSYLAAYVKPSHYVLSDPLHRLESDRDFSKRIWHELDAHPEIQLFTPHTWYSTLKDHRPFTMYFNDCDLEGWTKNISPLKPRGYLTLTAYKALALAIHLGYARIYIIGFDNTNYLNFYVNDSGRIFYGGDTHFYSADSPPIDVSDVYPQGMADCLFDHSRTLLDLERCFGHTSVINLDLNSSTSAFTKFADSRFVTKRSL
jgi:hypothetical protein